MKGSHRLVAVATGPMMGCGTVGGDTPSTSGAAQSNHPPAGTSYRGNTTLVARSVVAALPGGTVFSSVSDLTAPAGAAVQSPSTAGILYVVSGAANVSGVAPQELKGGEAAFLAPGTAHVANPGTTGAEWYLIAVQSAADRGCPGPLAGATRIFATDDLPPVPQINQGEALQRTALLVGGRSEVYRPNGVEVLLGIDRTAHVQASALHGPEQLSRGKLAFVLEGMAVHVLNPVRRRLLTSLSSSFMSCNGCSWFLDLQHTLRARIVFADRGRGDG